MEYVTTHEILKECDLKKLFFAGKISHQALRDVKIYEDYKKLKNNPCKMCIWDALEEKYNIKENRLREIVKDLGRKISLKTKKSLTLE